MGANLRKKKKKNYRGDGEQSKQSVGSKGRRGNMFSVDSFDI